MPARRRLYRLSLLDELLRYSFKRSSRLTTLFKEAAYAFAKQTKPDIADEPKQALAQSKNMAAAIAKKAIAVLA